MGKIKGVAGMAGHGVEAAARRAGNLAGVDSATLAMRAANADFLGVFQGQNVLYLRARDFLTPERADDADESEDEFPNAKPNELVVSLLRGEDLASRKGLMKKRGAAPDPRIRFDLYDASGKKRKGPASAARKATTNPEWNETFDLAIDERCVAIVATCEDWDDLAPPGLLGKVEVDISGLSKAPGRLEPAWRELGSSGKAAKKRKGRGLAAVSGSLKLGLRSRYSARVGDLARWS